MSSSAQVRPALSRIFNIGFRPFFFAAGIWGGLALALWLPAFMGYLVLPTRFDPVTWHAHEMIFGFVAAAMAGFLLTAMPNWTGRPALTGLPLAGLALLWLAGRLAVAFSGIVGASVAAVVDIAFLVLLLAVAFREILAARSWRNLPVLIVVGGLVASNAAVHWEAIEGVETAVAGYRAGVALVVVLIALIGGRIIPAFTGNWLAKGGLESRRPPAFGWVDGVALSILMAGLIAWVVMPEGAFSGALLIVAGIVSAFRLARWRGHLVLGEPLLSSLHLGFGWLVVGLVLLGLGVGGWAALPPTAGLHALTAGAMGTMTLAVMTRATFGHTSRPLTADNATAAIYAGVTLAALLRIAAAVVPEALAALLALSTVFWVGAFGLFTLRYAPLWWRG